MQSEAKIQADIIRALGKDPTVRIWRNNVGEAIPIGQFKTWRARAQMLHRSGQLQALNQHLGTMPRPVRYSINGAADITGIRDDGKRLEVEVKSAKGRLSDAQRAYQAMIERMGGVYIVARSVADVGH